MRSPPKFLRGERLDLPAFRVKLQQLSDCIAERTPGAGAGTRLQSGPTGFSYSADRATTGTPPYPFQLFAGITIHPGTVDGIMATLDTVALDTLPKPKISLAEGSHIISLKITWHPAKDIDEDANWFMVPGGECTALEITTTPEADWPPAETMPEVDTSGTETDGIFYQRIGKYTAITQGEGEAAKVVVTYLENDTLRHSLSASFCPPSQLSLSIL